MQCSSRDELPSGRVPHIQYGIGQRTIITHAHRYPLIDGRWAGQKCFADTGRMEHPVGRVYGGVKAGFMMK